MIFNFELGTVRSERLNDIVIWLSLPFLFILPILSWIMHLIMDWRASTDMRKTLQLIRTNQNKNKLPAIQPSIQLLHVGGNLVALL